jgi:hypothetical protein
MLSDKNFGAGLVIDRPDLKLVDTREMPWEDHEGIPQAKQKVLAWDDEGHPAVQFTWMNPGRDKAPPKRHYHSTVHEHGFALFGELPMREYESLEDERGRPVLFKRGYYMDRLPGSIHGIDPDLSPDIGFVMLDWRDGPGTYLQEEAAKRESVLLSASREIDTVNPLFPAGSPPETVVDSGKLRLLDTRAMAWEPMPTLPGAQWKVLSRDDAGEAEVFMIWVGPRPTGGAAQRQYHKTVLERGFCVDGELAMREFNGVDDEVGERVLYKQGLFMDRSPGSGYGVDVSRQNTVGFTFLGWRTGTGTFAGEKGSDAETTVLPAADLPD